jgi:hypothetical protein
MAISTYNTINTKNHLPPMPIEFCCCHHEMTICLLANNLICKPSKIDRIRPPLHVEVSCKLMKVAVPSLRMKPTQE